MSYRIYSTGSLALFLTTDNNSPQITINKNYNTTSVLSTWINNKASPWLLINATNNDLETYDITIFNSASSSININILFEQSDPLSFKSLYEGIIAYDAFVSK